MRQGKRKDCLFSRYCGDMIKFPKIPSPLFVFFPHSSMTIPGQATLASTPSFHVVVLTVTSDCDSFAAFLHCAANTEQ